MTNKKECVKEEKKCINHSSARKCYRNEKRFIKNHSQIIQITKSTCLMNFIAELFDNRTRSSAQVSQSWSGRMSHYLEV